ncbi:MAG TPA: family 78 glycoside hydrolase catalytic domain [Vicinamibacterales bacterium]|nr:family 78 glycoside hydrolase catalytic domain [Vicinamibacterales bacterium]
MKTRCQIALSIALVLLASRAFGAPAVGFRAAKPVWPEGRATEMNLLVGFRAVIPAPSAGEKVVLRVAASTLYRASVNGTFVGHGPARAAHGFYRVDEWDVTAALGRGPAVVSLEVAGYNANSYYLLDQPSFLLAEVTAGDTVLAATRAGATKSGSRKTGNAERPVPFDAAILDHRVQKVQRYSFQRPFIEVYRLAPGFDRWLREPAAPFRVIEVEEVSPKTLLPRRVPYPDFAVTRPVAHVAEGRVEKRAQVERLWKDRALTNIGPKLKGFPQGELERVVSTEMQHLGSTQPASLNRKWREGDEAALAAGHYRILDLGQNLTGFIGMTVEVAARSELRLAFDEVLTGGDVDFKRLGTVSVVSYSLEPGTYRLETLEPYTLRYLKAINLEGECRLRDVYLRELSHPAVAGARFAASDERLNRLFEAGVSTFRQNTLDVFMDCPSRERAGWLCDSFFTARSAFSLTGLPAVEDAFFENYLRAARFEHLPDGMLPMCYPADHYDGVFIPNWAMWFVVQLEEYVSRGGDREVVEGLRARVLRLLDFLATYENADGLLEKLPSWVFVEWSEANKFVQDVNYPSNMLYAQALDVAGRLYGMPGLSAKAERVRATVRRQSFDGEFFVDNAVRRPDGTLQVTRNRTEVCQYFAFFFGVADTTGDAALWEKLRGRFGPDRKETRAFPEIHPANSFIGNMLRMELLSRAGRSQQILEESIGYLLYMVERTGTLWENVGAEASLNHGFASHIVRTLQRDVLGVHAVDPLRKVITLRFGDAKLAWCEGTVPTPDGPVRLRWWRDGGALDYRVEVPAGYRVEVGGRDPFIGSCSTGAAG